MPQSRYVDGFVWLIAEVYKRWSESSWGKKLAAQEKKKQLTDFDRYKLKVARSKVSIQSIRPNHTHEHALADNSFHLLGNRSEPTSSRSMRSQCLPEQGGQLRIQELGGRALGRRLGMRVLCRVHPLRSRLLRRSVVTSSSPSTPR